MTEAKLREWLDRYERVLDGLDDDPDSAHLRSMIPKMRVLLEEGRREKLMRWIGFVQGALWVSHIFTLEELKDHNRPDGDLG